MERLGTSYLFIIKRTYFLLQKFGQGRLNYILTKKMRIKCFKFNWHPVFSLLGELVLLKLISTLQKEQSCNEESFVSNINSVALKTEELLSYHCGYHGNIVTIAT